ncbi:MAG: DNA alkylation repair protein [Acidimicrobiia bacterium]|nr:DNA alkylation repair protein [Acidimicrobiia bacterium]NNJ47152.1 DNA alkylation repair protein [Acidimicrobiia bacterium]
MGDERFLLKDMFNRETIGVIADAVAAADSRFDPAAFLASVFDDEWGDRELKQRMRHAAECLRAGLPDDYGAALEILVRAAPSADAAGFAAMILSDFVEAFGIDDLAASIPALEVFTRNVSAEFAVRPFLVRYPDRMLEQMHVWAASDQPDLRRLASEGTRPRLPWGMALKQYQADPAPLFPLLEGLAHDPSEVVRRSVANNLNDIAKDHPDLVVDVLARWQDGSAEVSGITRHALRVLLKQGHIGALRLLGFEPDPAVALSKLSVEPGTVPVGGKVSVRFTVRSTADEPQSVMVDGVVHYARPTGATTKVFKWKTGELGPGETWSIERSVTLKPMSTRRIEPGIHSCEVQINGDRVARIEFEVTA